MRQRRIRIAALTALVVVGVLVGFLVSRPVAQDAVQVDSPLLGTAAPRVTASTLGHTTVSLDSLRGRIVVLTFFASWCAACQAEAPNLVTYAWHVRRDHVPATVLGVVYNDGDAAVASFAQRDGVTFPVLTDPSGQLANDFAVASPPVTIVLSPSGRVAAVLQGPVTAHQLDVVTSDALRTTA
jgi:cytochrome c biogenesis protein CcmG, thiol:disulfide interchange protein DsbE